MRIVKSFILGAIFGAVGLFYGLLWIPKGPEVLGRWLGEQISNLIDSPMALSEREKVR